MLGQQFAPHGLCFDDAVLDDARRTLIKRRHGTPRLRSALALRRLEEVLNDLDVALAQRA